jgi:hypothetical protein
MSAQLPDDQRPDGVEQEPERATKSAADERAVAVDPVDVRDLLRRALEPPRSEHPRTVLPAVQQAIRTASKGRFFADGWSTSTAPRSTYLVTAIVMLLVTVVVWVLMRPQDLELLR